MCDIVKIGECCFYSESTRIFTEGRQVMQSEADFGVYEHKSMFDVGQVCRTQILCHCVLHNTAIYLDKVEFAQFC